MAFVKCGFCSKRIRPMQKLLHEKKCIYARRARKNKDKVKEVKVNPFGCDQCEFIAKSKSGLGVHKRSHKEKEE